jgi:ribosome-associated heat shock protein Hsp15
VKVGDALRIESAHGDARDVAIAGIPSRRGPAPEAARAYTESAESIERRRRAAEERSLRKFVPPTSSKPDKRTRRLIKRARQRASLSES